MLLLGRILREVEEPGLLGTLRDLKLPSALDERSVVTGAEEERTVDDSLAPSTYRIRSMPS